MLRCDKCSQDYQLCPQCSALSCPGVDCCPDECPNCKLPRKDGAFPTTDNIKEALDTAAKEIAKEIRIMKCIDCGDVDHLEFDGGVLGPELSSVRMQVQVFNSDNSEGSEFKVRAHPKDDYYWETLDQEAWVKKAAEWLATLPTVLCPKCDNTVRLNVMDYSSMSELNPMTKINKAAMKDLHGGGVKK